MLPLRYSEVVPRALDGGGEHAALLEGGGDLLRQGGSQGHPSGEAAGACRAPYAGAPSDAGLLSLLEARSSWPRAGLHALLFMLYLFLLPYVSDHCCRRVRLMVTGQFVK